MCERIVVAGLPSQVVLRPRLIVVCVISFFCIAVGDGDVSDGPVVSTTTLDAVSPPPRGSATMGRATEEVVGCSAGCSRDGVMAEASAAERWPSLLQ
jgi:hypothetical protein